MTEISPTGIYKDGRAIAMSVDPNTSNDVCSFCRHSKVLGFMSIECTLGHTPYFRSLSNVGMIFVSDCGAGELKPELQAFDETRGLSASEPPSGGEAVTPNPPEVSRHQGSTRHQIRM